MSSYSALLEDYYIEEKYANETFSSLGSYLESVTEFANESVNFEVTISLEEAVTGDIKNKVGKIGGSIKKAIEALIKRINDFRVKITEAVKRFVAKAKQTIALKGNQAMKKILENKNAVIGKDVKLTAIKGGDGAVKTIFKAAVEAGNSLKGKVGSGSGMLNKLQDFASGTVEKAVTALSQDITSSEVVEKVTISASENMKVGEAYMLYVGDYLSAVETNLTTVEGLCKSVIADTNNISKELNKIKDKSDVQAAEVSAASNFTNMAIKLSTYTVNFAMSILTFTTKNSAKLALAAVDGDGRALAAGAKAAGKKVGGAVAGAGKTVSGAVKGAGSKVKGAFKKKGSEEELTEEEA